MKFAWVGNKLFEAVNWNSISQSHQERLGPSDQPSHEFCISMHMSAPVTGSSRKLPQPTRLVQDLPVDTSSG